MLERELEPEFVLELGTFGVTGCTLHAQKTSESMIKAINKTYFFICQIKSPFKRLVHLLWISLKNYFVSIFSEKLSLSKETSLPKICAISTAPPGVTA